MSTPTQTILDTWDFSDKPYTKNTFQGVLRMTGPRRLIFAKLYGHKPTDDQLRDFWPTGEQAHAYLLERDDAAGPRVTPTVVQQAEFSQRVTDRLADYHAAYEISAPNDRRSIQQIATWEIQLEDISEKLTGRRGSGLTPEVVKQLRDEEKALSTLVRDNTKDLGITRADREKRRQENRAEDIVENVVLRTKAFLQDRVVRLRCGAKTCPHPDVDLGWLYLPFKHDSGAEFSTRCPACHRRIRLTWGFVDREELARSGTPSSDVLASIGPEEEPE